MHHAREVGVESFERGAREALLSDAEDWSFDEELAQLDVEMTSVADVFRKDETNKMINGVEVSCSFLLLKVLTGPDESNDREISRRKSLSRLTLVSINPILICGTVSSLASTT